MIESFPPSAEVSLRRTRRGSPSLQRFPGPPPSARGRGGAGAAARSGLGRFVSGAQWALCERAGPLGLAVLSHEPQKNARIRDVCHPGAGCSGREVTGAFSPDCCSLSGRGVPLILPVYIVSVYAARLKPCSVKERIAMRAFLNSYVLGVLLHFFFFSGRDTVPSQTTFCPSAHRNPVSFWERVMLLFTPSPLFSFFLQAAPLLPCHWISEDC